MKNRFLFLIGFVLIATLVSCKKESEQLNTASIETYNPLKVGKFIEYRLDSLVFVSFGSFSEIHSYKVKYEVNSSIIDNLGRPSWRIFRYIKPLNSGSYTPDATFTATNTGKGLEFVENNMRFLKLQLPFREGYSWKGNSFIDTYSGSSNVRYLDDWDYIYEDANLPKTVGSLSFDSTVTVQQRNDSIGLPLTPQTQYAEKNLGREIYAANVGLVFKQFTHFEFQRVDNTYKGYGITLTILSHN